MARKTVVTLVSDLNGEEIGDGEGETLRFALDGVDYEADLFTDQAEELRELLQPYIAAGRRIGGRAKRGKAASAGGSDRKRSKEVRDWARSQGIEVADRGRIPEVVLSAFNKANPGAAA